MNRIKSLLKCFVVDLCEQEKKIIVRYIINFLGHTDGNCYDPARPDLMFTSASTLNVEYDDGLFYEQSALSDTLWDLGLGSR